MMMTGSGEPRRGSCACGSVVYEVTPPLRDVIACHCTQCRKTSGHYWVASSVPMDRFRLVEDRGLAWYRSSPEARRGFCRDCGASLLWKPEGEDRMSFSPAALDGPTGLVTTAHIFTVGAGDYYAPQGPPPAARTAPTRLLASCLCGGVRFDLPGPAMKITACHCRQCRKLSGHYAASFKVDEGAVVITANDSLAEFASLWGGQRGFCTVCGASLYFRATDGGLSIEAGAVDGPTGGVLAGHVFLAEAGDYHVLDDGLPQFDGAD